ncbi:uncharacterized protein N7446_000718 [Penicillium canescens]|uniref:Uncharacterized protein n=1 Tax=Penicillium canescens TaxID=5083 RepID=A0AAD6N4U3_PENCN|nr:uncharacterized protein N7446_000718 [Penicillium canescens]KAJ6030222.1 hypothetical protein N7460_010488 [Penicillium canescens]KAJ6060597.1 hypothetical protein N7444_002451 [Penicillium canescens]KAJ6077782.1 hypothetical protein N7446_000718 [Penicillium canescens]
MVVWLSKKEPEGRKISDQMKSTNLGDETRNGVWPLILNVTPTPLKSKNQYGLWPTGKFTSK